jgi:hypothetical protein
MVYVGKIELQKEVQLGSHCDEFAKEMKQNVATPLLEECEDDTHTPEMGTWESSGTPETSEFNCRGQNTLS